MQRSTVIIKSLLVQNAVMGLALALVLGLFLLAFLRGKRGTGVLALVWLAGVLWFFNSPLWGFSAISVKPGGVELRYGFLAVLKNTTIRGEPEVRIVSEFARFPQNRKLYWLQIGSRRSMKVDRGGYQKLQAARQRLQAASESQRP